MFARSLRYEREKPARVVDGDLVEDLVGRAGGLHLRHEHRHRLRVAARGVRREHQVIGMAGLDERHHHRHLLRSLSATAGAGRVECPHEDTPLRFVAKLQAAGIRTDAAIRKSANASRLRIGYGDREHQGLSMTAPACS